ncbi:MAG: hypothetical protein QOE90_554 [Thermoplasmata archaeon]|jgi:hypothetical protein|nr:hypothetical protein [Thermoplasmata archaeon]
MFCALCGQHARHPKSPVLELRRKECPRFPDGVIHRGCCAGEVCSFLDSRGHVRCGWEIGGKERLEVKIRNQLLKEMTSPPPAADVAHD